jgi:hypothetical protein
VTGRYANGDTGEMCVIDLPSFAAAFGHLAVEGFGFPLRGVVKDPSGNMKIRIEITSYDEHPIEDSRFEIPAGYTRVSPPKH